MFWNVCLTIIMALHFWEGGGLHILNCDRAYNVNTLVAEKYHTDIFPFIRSLKDLSLGTVSRRTPWTALVDLKHSKALRSFWKRCSMERRRSFKADKRQCSVEHCFQNLCRAFETWKSDREVQGILPGYCNLSIAIKARYTHRLMNRISNHRLMFARCSRCNIRIHIIMQRSRPFVCLAEENYRFYAPYSSKSNCQYWS